MSIRRIFIFVVINKANLIRILKFIELRIGIMKYFMRLELKVNQLN